jgi:hypothetical protein
MVKPEVGRKKRFRAPKPRHQDLKPAILSVFISAKKFDLWAPNEHVYQLPYASFLCEYFRCVGKLLEDGHFDEANNEALSWKPFLDKVKLS